MARRTKTAQSAHDAEVRRVAKQLKGQGYDVTADVRGYPQPKTIGGYRPDVVGKRGGQRRIVEVETSESVDTKRDLGQQRAFEQAANRSKDTTFSRRVVKK